MAWGVRQYHSVFPDKREGLVVALLVYDEDTAQWLEIVRIPGEEVARVRALLQRVEVDHPHLVGTDEGIDELERSEPDTGHLH